MAKVKRGQGIMTDDWRNIDGLVDLVLTRALAMSERQSLTSSLISYCVTCDDGTCLVSDPVFVALVVQGRHLTADLHLGARGPGWPPASCKSCLEVYWLRLGSRTDLYH